MWARDDRRRSFLGVALDAFSRQEVVAQCEAALVREEALSIGVINSAKLVSMRRDSRLASAVLSCDLVLADGQSVVWASRWLSQPLPERVAGIDLMSDLLALAAIRGELVYFLGATRDVLTTMIDNLTTQHPGLRVAGARDGYFAWPDGAGAVADAIRRSGARLLFVGMPSPQKELFLADYGDRTGAIVLHGVGGSFDVLAGVTRRAPHVWQRLGLEWLFRLLQEPRRLLARYAKTNTAFVALVVREKLLRQRSEGATTPALALAREGRRHQASTRSDQHAATTWPVSSQTLPDQRLPTAVQLK